MSAEEYVTAPSGKKVKKPGRPKKKPSTEQPTAQTWSVDHTEKELTTLLGEEGQQLTVETKNLPQPVQQGDVLDSNFEPLPAATRETKEKTAELQQQNKAADKGDDITIGDRTADPQPPANRPQQPPATQTHKPEPQAPSDNTAQPTRAADAARQARGEPVPPSTPATPDSSFPTTAKEYEAFKKEITDKNPPHPPPPHSTNNRQQKLEQLEHDKPEWLKRILLLIFGDPRFLKAAETNRQVEIL